MRKIKARMRTLLEYSERILAAFWFFTALLWLIEQPETPWWSAAVLMVVLGTYSLLDHFYDQHRKVVDQKIVFYEKVIKEQHRVIGELLAQHQEHT